MINTLITLVTFYIINTLLDLPYNLANSIGYVLGLINSFVWNKNWVFKSHKGWMKEAALFIGGFLICFGIQLLATNYMLNGLGMKDMELISWLPMKNTGENVVMCIGMVIYTLANYCYNRFVTFKQ